MQVKREQLDAARILRPFGALAARQTLNVQVGSLHAAGWATPEGELTDVLEDVGRHNALDKLFGRLALAIAAMGPSALLDLNPDGPQAQTLKTLGQQLSLRLGAPAAVAQG